MTGTIEITGTGGIIEGNLGAANVNVNLDPVHGNFNGTTSIINAGSPTMFDDIFNGAGSLTFWIYPRTVGENSEGRILTKDKWEVYTHAESGGFCRVSFIQKFSTTNGHWRFTDRVVPLNHWSHIAIVYDGSSTSNDAVMYLNGIAQTITEAGTPDGSRTSDASDDLIIGNNSGTSRTFDGYIADVKIYKAAGLSSTQIPIAAAKINQEPDLISSNPPKGWYKLTADTTTDSSGNSNTASASNMGSVVYDAFSVDVYDNSTTTDGTFTVTQGKVEGLALSSVDFSGDTQLISCTSNTFYNSKTAFSVSGWFNHDNTHDGHLLHTIVNARDSGNDGMAISLDSTNDRIRFRIGDGSSDDLYTGNSTIINGQWHHFVATRDASNNTAIYIDGVSAATGSSSKTISISSGNFGIGGRPSDTDGDEFSGKIRDVGCWSYALSADQVASLYSDTYPQTPNHQYKLDEGHATAALNNASGAFEDSGTETDADGQGIGLVDASCINGTLDLDGTLTIAANGTLSAPRGNLDVGGNMASSGALTHNNGKVRFTEHLQVTGTSLTFYNMSWDGSNTKTIDLMNDTTIENELDGNNQWRLKASSNTVTLTMGTATSQGTIDTTGMSSYGLEWDSNTSNFVKIKGVNSLFPAIITGTNIDWDDVSSGLVRLENCDFQGDITTGGGGVTITLTGDCEFDAVTVSSGDTLDLNGQRAEFSGDFDLTTGALSMNDSMAIFTGNIDFNGRVITSNTGSTIIHDPPSTSEKLITSLYFGGNFFARGVESDVNSYAWGGASGEYPAKVFVGGQLDCQQSVKTTTLMQVATGGELRGNDRTLTCEGDFTTSGGLIGTSAVNFDDTDSNTTGFINCGSDSAMDDQFDGGATLEAWIKPTTKGQNNTYGGMIASKVYWYFSTRTDSGSNSCKLTFKQFFSGDDSEWTSTDFVIDYNKYSHVAVTYDSSNVANELTMYVNGKQVAVTRTNAATGSATSDASKDFIIGNYDNDDNVHFDGTIAMMRFFDDIRTVSELRADMFNEHANMANTGNLLAMWQFDEGTGTTIDNKGSVGAAADGTLTAGSVSGGWAGGGTFTRGTSTVNMTGASGKLHLGSTGYEFNNLGVAPSGGTTTLTKVGGHSNLRVYGTLTHNSGTFAQSGNMDIEILGSGTVSAGATLPYIVYWNSSTNVPTSNYQYFIANGNTITFGGNCTFTGYWRTGANKIVGGEFSHSVRQLVADSGGTFDLRNTTVTMTGTTSSTNLHDPNSTLITGNTTIIGHISGSNKTNWTSPAAAGHEIVGNVSNLDFQAGNDLTIVGSVTNCTGEGFRQWHHTLDTQQLLDADEAGDDDLRLEKPNLDNANELQTG